MITFTPVLKNKYFLALWVSQILSQLTISLMNFTLIERIFERTGSAVAVSLFWVSYTLPAILFLPLAGPFVDTFSRKSILFFTNLAQAGVMAVLLAFYRQLFLIYPLVFLYSSINQFYLPSEASSIPDLVDKKDLSNANSLFLLTVQAMFLVGFGFGGLILSVLGYRLIFSLGLILLLLAAFSVTSLPQPQKKRLSFTKNIFEYLDEFKEGFNYLKTTPGVLFPLMLLVIGMSILSLTGAIFPLIGREILSVSVRNAGLAIFLPVGLGAFISALVTPRLTKIYRRRRLIEIGIAGMSISLVFLAWVVPYVPLRFLFSSLSLFTLGSSGILSFLPSQTIIQERTPAVLRGRILSTMGFFTSLTSIIPIILGAAIAELLGIKSVLTLLALVMSIILYYSRIKGDAYIFSHRP